MRAAQHGHQQAGTASVRIDHSQQLFWHGWHQFRGNCQKIYEIEVFLKKYIKKSGKVWYKECFAWTNALVHTDLCTITYTKITLFSK
jgi:hypothetical protein